MSQRTKVTAPNSSSKHFAVFLSHNSSEKAVVERIAEKLKRAEIEPWLDKWCLTSGGDWQDELAGGLRASASCAVFVGPHGIGNWEDLEYKLATDRMAKDRAFHLFLVLLPGLPEPFDTGTLPPFLSIRTWVDLRRGIEDNRAFQSLINAIKGLPLGPERPIEPRNDICPYRGLQTFAECILVPIFRVLRRTLTRSSLAPMADCWPLQAEQTRETTLSESGTWLRASQSARR